MAAGDAAAGGSGAPVAFADDGLVNGGKHMVRS